MRWKQLAFPMCTSVVNHMHRRPPDYPSVEAKLDLRIMQVSQSLYHNSIAHALL